MPGAIPPSDWDGATYNCIQIKMPDSEQFRAFLLGQLLEAASPGFWDEARGDADQAAAAFETAYRLMENSFPEECPQMYRHRAFKAKLVTPQAIPANTWTPLNFEGIVYWTNTGTPSEASGYDVSSMAHGQLEGFHGSAEFWIYKVQVAFQNYNGAIQLRWNIPTNTENYLQAAGSNYIEWVSHHRWLGETYFLRPEIFIQSTGTVEPSPGTTYFAGQIVGRLE